MSLSARALLVLVPWPWTGRRFLLPIPHLEGCAEGCLVQDVSEVPLLIVLGMPRA